MSSFVMDKQEFIKVAGFCAGLADCKNNFHEPVLRVWNYAAGKVYTGEDFYKAFNWLFTLNALSVQLQYGDKEPCTDENNYLDTFNVYRKKTAKFYQFGDKGEKQKIVEGVYKYFDFCNCLLYQVEDPDCEMKVKGFVYRVGFELVGILERITGNSQDSGWGEFDLFDN